MMELLSGIIVFRGLERRVYLTDVIIHLVISYEIISYVAIWGTYGAR